MTYMTEVERISREGKRGNVHACLQMLLYYARGANGLKKDTWEAKKWGQKAISFAAENTSLKYQVVPTQKYKSVKEKALGDDVDSCIQMAIWCAAGTSQIFTDMSEAKKWIDKVVTLYASSTERANSLIHKDYSNMSVDELMQIANSGDVMACMALATIYTKGNSNVFPDSQVAQHWLNLAESMQPGISKSFEKDSYYDDGNESENEDDEEEEESVYFDKRAFLDEWFSNSINFQL